MLKVGIVGLPNAGKSTLFNALVEKPQAGVASHPFTTIDKNAGVVNVPDSLLFELAKIENIPRVTSATITFVDIAGLIKGAHQGEGLGNQFLHHIREVDLVLHVLRFFKDPMVPHVHESIDPKEDYDIVNQELLFADIEVVERRLKNKKVQRDEREFLEKLLKHLDGGSFAREFKFKEEEWEWVKGLNLLTLKKQIVVANIGEDSLDNPPKEVDGLEVIPICAKLEAELGQLPWVERRKFMKEFGILYTAKERIIKECYKSLDITTFYTIAKGNEARAWTVKKGSTVWEAAGKIHTDFQKNFVKAFVINAKELVKIGSWQKAVEKGRVNVVGKEYTIKDQDVIEIKVRGGGSS